MKPLSLKILKDRASQLEKVRQFFKDRSVMEVDCPILCEKASVDTHIDLIQTEDKRFLHSSPEYHMKRLLCEGASDIYQLSHVFRKGEIGRLHNPEFMMVEWYRKGSCCSRFIDETLEFISLFLGTLDHEKITYSSAMKTYCGIDPFLTSQKELIQYIKDRSIPTYQGFENDGKDACLNLILAHAVEPHLGKDCLTVITHYPETQAMLAKKIKVDRQTVADRFEVYYKGIELANGYNELNDAKEQKRRFEKANEERVKLRKEPYPIDEAFLKALQKGLPDCLGVAVGFDRLMMLRHNKQSINEVISFSYNEA